MPRLAQRARPRARAPGPAGSRRRTPPGACRRSGSACRAATRRSPSSRAASVSVPTWVGTSKVGRVVAAEPAADAQALAPAHEHGVAHRDAGRRSRGWSAPRCRPRSGRCRGGSASPARAQDGEEVVDRRSVAGVAAPSLTPSGPRRQSATSCSPMTSGRVRRTSRASSFARAGKSVAWTCCHSCVAPPRSPRARWPRSAARCCRRGRCCGSSRSASGRASPRPRAAASSATSASGSSRRLGIARAYPRGGVAARTPTHGVPGLERPPGRAGVFTHPHRATP